MYALNLGWQGGQKKWSLEVPGGTSSPLLSWLLLGMGKSHKDLSPLLSTFITLLSLTPPPNKGRELCDQRSGIH